MIRRLLTTLVLVIGLSAVPVVATSHAESVKTRSVAVHAHASFRANHITSYDCEVNDEQRGPFSNFSAGIRWVNGATSQQMTQLRGHNWDVYPHTITARYQRFTDGHVYKQRAWAVGSGATFTWLSPNGDDFDGTAGHSQIYHAGVKFYSDSTYVMSMDLWYDAYRGSVTFVATVLNCTPQSVTAMQSDFTLAA